MKKKSILICGGGTGGHLSPAIALYEECRKAGVPAVVLVGLRDRQFGYLREIDPENLIHYGAPAFSINPLALPFFALRFGLAVLFALRLMKKRKVIAVVGMGGYVSAPALIAARISGRDIYLCEQNTVPGKVTLRFGRRARRIFATFEESVNYFRKPVSMITVGNPIRSKVLSTPDRDTARRMFNLSHCKKVVLLIGGSQGALALNELILNLRTRYAADFGEVGIIWCTGSLSYDKYAKIVRENSAFGSVYISPFIEDMGPAYRAADIAISRSGSGVMMEMAALELPSVLIPYPHAAADHQSKNADAFVKAGAAVKVDQAKAGADDFAPVFFSILKSGARLEAMRMACHKAAKPHAARDILNEICGD